jgi:hypothetical protein
LALFGKIRRKARTPRISHKNQAARISKKAIDKLLAYRHTDKLGKLIGRDLSFWYR